MVCFTKKQVEKILCLVARPGLHSSFESGHSQQERVPQIFFLSCCSSRSCFWLQRTNRAELSLRLDEGPWNSILFQSAGTIISSQVIASKVAVFFHFSRQWNNLHHEVS